MVAKIPPLTLHLGHYTEIDHFAVPPVLTAHPQEQEGIASDQWFLFVKLS
jgi:hypothetical protein